MKTSKFLDFCLKKNFKEKNKKFEKVGREFFWEVFLKSSPRQIAGPPAGVGGGYKGDIILTRIMVTK